MQTSVRAGLDLRSEELIHAATEGVHPVHEPPGGRLLGTGMSVQVALCGGLAMFIGPLIWVTALVGSPVAMWQPASPVTWALTGAALLGIFPAATAASRCTFWEDARIVVGAVLGFLIGLSLLLVANLDDLGGTRFLTGYAYLGGAATLLLVALGALGLVGQLREPAFDLPSQPALARWTRIPLAVLGAGWLGVGVGLVGWTGFWAPLVPWETTALDARLLGVWGLVVGLVILVVLTVDDVVRVRTAVFAALGVGGAALLTLVVFAREIDWATGGALAALALVGGLLAAGGAGLVATRGGTRGWYRGRDY